MDGITEKLSEASIERRRRSRKRQAGEFIRGPLPLAWVSHAATLPGKSLAVGMAIWFRTGCRPDRKYVSVCNSTLKRFGVSRTAGYRALRALEQAGLITVERHRGRCPRVTLAGDQRQANAPNAP